MASNVFISFRFKDGIELKDELVELFSNSREVFNRSEDVDRTHMSEDTIQKYLYDKLKNTSITIVILTPEAVNYKKDIFGVYDDWLYDELRYSLEDRQSNRTNGVIALYTEESKHLVKEKSIHTCSVCNKERTSNTILNFDNLVRKNMMNVKESYKCNKCSNLYDGDYDSYISLVHFDDFKSNIKKYIEIAKEKRDRKEQFNIVKRMS
ncbi:MULTISPECIES: TIR domain-containing protein [Enterococcus]|uniref:TIR domain-containing protein n=1 Tax=Enterococcus TaxID=1350 RepID=UPI0020186558|nr:MULTISPECIES: TIR domain-containing protein [Enterococcus]MDT2341243.1 TIR domain-containing protein [Enterococcus faecium]MDT2701824.1 TIR domain-containing protein [Enterococcus gallinarum]MDV7738479.1 TIR domain-containing protein [Enterococcus casseliflavus]MDV7743436.1 TIR domain-containing protein [Enterococcus gallinarum]MEB8418482.1 TIR domain-containing protein [Enterococcus casseliflavus]